ncbi:class I SAM-dependent methyltransferase [Fodinibius sp. Rm-B-1B1-1]|uniref:class I SAM-dependent methyltransferase n=1 Tax=Fodinibius alkaliphilus TaxID=3140241 RepID=UPI003159E6E5
MRPELQRRVQRYGWDYSSPYYQKGWERQLRPAQEKLLRRVDLQSGEKVLDISCGTGLVTFPMAKEVGEEGNIIGIDLSEKMIEEAKGIFQNLEVSNVKFMHMDAESLDFSDTSFDVAVNSLGLMYYPNPDKAIQEMNRVTKSGGRAAALVWGRRSACGWAGIFPIVDAQVKTDVCPLFFQLGTGDTLAKEFKEAGFTDVESERFEVLLPYQSDGEAIIGAFQGGAVALAYRKFDKQTKEKVHAEYIESIKPFKDGTSYEIPGEFVIVSGRKYG